MNIGGKDNETLEAYFNYCCCGNAVVGDPLWERIAESFAFFECCKKFVDAGFANRKLFGNFPATHAKGIVLDNDVFVVQ